LTKRGVTPGKKKKHEGKKRKNIPHVEKECLVQCGGEGGGKQRGFAPGIRGQGFLKGQRRKKNDKLGAKEGGETRGRH